MRWYLLCIWNILTFQVMSQPEGQWTWIAGSDTTIEPVYGVQGVPGPNVTPGFSYEAACWTSMDGNLWLYGGLDGSQNMWMFDVGQGMWTWKSGPGEPIDLYGSEPIYGTSGVFSNTVMPGITSFGEHAEWVDENGMLWLFTAFPSSSMWKYDTGTDQWAWMHGNIPINLGLPGVPDPLNNPYLVESPVAWVANDGNFWMFNGSDAEMWRFDIATNMWTCMSGTFNTNNNIGPIGEYGANYSPEPSWYYQHWRSDDGTFYLLETSDYTRMWQFNPEINQWRIVHEGSQDNIPNFNGICEFHEENVPSCEMEQRASWKDECNRFYGYDLSYGAFIFCFDPSINQYALVHGEPTQGTSEPDPVYGEIGVSSSTVFPGYQMGNASWVDNQGNFWMLSSWGFVLTNALLRFVPDYGCFGESSIISSDILSSVISGCAPLQVSFEAQANLSNAIYDWDFGDTSSSSNSSNLQNPTHTFNSPGTYFVQLIANSVGNCNSSSDTSTIQIIVNEPPNFSLTDDVTICEGMSVLLEVSGASNAIWSPNEGLNTLMGNQVLASPNQSITYFVEANVGGCSAMQSVHVNVIAEYSPECNQNHVVVPNVFTPNSDLTNDGFFIDALGAKNIKFVILNRWGNVLFEGDGLNPVWNGAVNGVDSPEGVYFVKYEISWWQSESTIGHSFFHLIR